MENNKLIDDVFADVTQVLFNMGILLRDDEKRKVIASLSGEACRRCGYCYDYCMCETNLILERLEALRLKYSTQLVEAQSEGMQDEPGEISTERDEGEEE